MHWECAERVELSIHFRFFFLWRSCFPLQCKWHGEVTVFCLSSSSSFIFFHLLSPPAFDLRSNKSQSLTGLSGGEITTVRHADLSLMIWFVLFSLWRHIYQVRFRFRCVMGNCRWRSDNMWFCRKGEQGTPRESRFSSLHDSSSKLKQSTWQLKAVSQLIIWLQSSPNTTENGFYTCNCSSEAGEESKHLTVFCLFFFDSIRLFWGMNLSGGHDLPAVACCVWLHIYGGTPAKILSHY